MIIKGFNFAHHPGQIIPTQILAIDTFAERHGTIKDVYMRIRGGTGLHTHANMMDVPAVHMGYIDAQNKHEFKVLWGISTGEIRTPAAERLLFDSMLSKGMKVHAIYLGNEQYWIQKYGKTPVQYLDWCQLMLGAFQDVDLPMLINISPEKNKVQIAWATEFYDELEKRPYIKARVEPDLHVYVPRRKFDWSIFDKTRQIWGDKRLWVTEYGARDDFDGELVPEVTDEVWVAQEIMSRLRADDVMIAHMLASNYDWPGSTQGFIHNGQWTQKGNALYSLLFAKKPTEINTKVVLTNVRPQMVENSWWVQTLEFSDGTSVKHIKHFWQNRKPVLPSDIGTEKSEVLMKYNIKF